MKSRTDRTGRACPCLDRQIVPARCTRNRASHPIGVDDQRCPALRSSHFACRPELLGIKPADDGVLALGIVAEPKRVVLIFGEVQALRPKARIDDREFASMRLVDGDLSGVLREALRPFRQRIKLRGAQSRLLIGAIFVQSGWSKLLAYGDSANSLVYRGRALIRKRLATELHLEYVKIVVAYRSSRADLAGRAFSFAHRIDDGYLNAPNQQPTRSGVSFARPRSPPGNHDRP
jgi:hypothetical protein